MKKVLSVILCAVMIACCFPFTVFAANAVLNGSTFSSGDLQPEALISNTVTEFNIPSGVTVTVPAGVTVYVPAGKTLLVKEGGKLEVLGTLIVSSGATLTVNGTITGGRNVTVEDQANASVVIKFTSLTDALLSQKIDNIYYFTAPSADADVNFKWFDDNGNVLDKNGDYDVASVFNGSDNKIVVPLKQYLFLKVRFKDKAETGKTQKEMFAATNRRMDEAKFVMYFNDSPIPYVQSCRVLEVAACGTVTYSRWTNDVDFYKEYNVHLPTGEGYEVIGRDWESSADGTVKLMYGVPFAFRVELDEAYDMSNYEVYFYNGYGFTNLSPKDENGRLLDDVTPILPDEYGFYTIPMIEGEGTVYVVGVTKNETIILVGNIVETIRNFFNMIMEFFQNLFSMFNLGA